MQPRTQPISIRRFAIYCVVAALSVHLLQGCGATPIEAETTANVESELQRVRIGMTQREVMRAIGAPTISMGMGVIHYQRWDFSDGTSFYPRWERPNDAEIMWNSMDDRLVAYAHYRTDSGDHVLNTCPYGTLQDPVAEFRRLEELNNTIREDTQQPFQRIGE